MDADLQRLLGPWAFHLDLLRPGENAPKFPWEIEAAESPEEATPEGEGTPRAAPADHEGPTELATRQSPSSPSDGALERKKERKKERKTERKAGGLARGFLNRTAKGGGADSGGEADAPPATVAMTAGSRAGGVASGSGTAKKKKLAPGHFWAQPPHRYEFQPGKAIKVGQWQGTEQCGETQKPTKCGVSRFYRLPALVPAADIDRVLTHAKQSKAYTIDADSVDSTPTFEYYPFRDGEWVDAGMRPFLEGIVENKVLPYIRERYDCRFCAVADILVRRYIPGERRTHAVHFDGHAFVTAVLGLSSPDDYEGGLYLQPEPDVASRAFLRIEPGDLVVHSFDLQHGVHVWKGVRHSVIFWVKDSLQAVRDRSTPWYDKPAESGDPDALYNIAQNYEYGMFGRPLDLAKSIELYERSAKAGHHFAQNNLGLIYRRAAEKLGLSNGMAKSVEWLKVVAEAGFAMGQKNLALAYANAHGVKRDDTQAALWMRRAAEQLEVEAAYMMGEMYRQGRGVPVDVGEATKWYERSADAGFPKAQYTVGMLYLEGTGTEKDLRKAEMWLRFAGKQGNAEAKNNLATMHAQRGEVEQAAEIWIELARQGEPNSQCNIGMCFLRGQGRPQSLTDARKWLKKAAKQGHQMAAQTLVQLGAAAQVAAD